MNNDKVVIPRLRRTVFLLPMLLTKIPVGTDRIRNQMNVEAASRFADVSDILKSAST